MLLRCIRLFIPLLTLAGCQKSFKAPAPPVGQQWTVRTIKFANTPDGTAVEMVALWKAKGIEFGVGKPYTIEAAQQALKAARQYFRDNKIRKAKGTLEIKPVSAGNLEAIIR